MPDTSPRISGIPTSMTLSDADRDALLTTLKCKRPDVVQARMANALLLLADGLSIEDVAGLLYIDETVLASWQKMFAARKLRKLA